MTIAEKGRRDKAWFLARVRRLWPVPGPWRPAGAAILALPAAFGLGLLWERQEALEIRRDPGFWVEQLPLAERDASLVLPAAPAAAPSAGKRGRKASPTKAALKAVSDSLSPSPLPEAPADATSAPAEPSPATSPAPDPHPPASEEPSAAPAPAPVPAGGEVVASKNGGSYYLPWCSGVKRISPANLVTFASAHDAEAKGYKPAKNCKGI